MLSAYIITAVLGIGLAAASTFMGHHEGGDAGHDGGIGAHGHDHDHDGAETDGPWIPFFSIRFWTYFCFGFGLTGVLLHYFTNVGEPNTATTAALTGFLTGLLVAGIMRFLQKQQFDTMTKSRDLEGEIAHVTVAIQESSLGKVRLNLHGETIDFLAKADGLVSIPAGQRVVIISMEGDHALVMPVTEISENNTLHA